MLKLSVKSVKSLVAIVVSIVMVSSPALVYAGDYNVSATVPYGVPTVPAVIDSRFAGLTVTNPTVTITGTCQQTRPASVVSLWSPASLMYGSASCVAGVFAIPITLISGASVLLPKISNILNAYGPDGVAITITYTPSTRPTIPAQPQPSSNIDPAVGALQFYSSEPASILQNTGETQITLYVAGGTSPYAITINWGDGATDTKSVQGMGKYTFSHIYAESKNYIINAVVKDVLGAWTQFYMMVSSPNPPSLSTDKGRTPMSAGSLKRTDYLLWRWLRYTWVPILVVIGYWYGLRRAKQKYEKRQVFIARKIRKK